jgi:hypothetical protein
LRLGCPMPLSHDRRFICFIFCLTIQFTAIMLGNRRFYGLFWQIADLQSTRRAFVNKKCPIPYIRDQGIPFHKCKFTLQSIFPL